MYKSWSAIISLRIDYHILLLFLIKSHLTSYVQTDQFREIDYYSLITVYKNKH